MIISSPPATVSGGRNREEGEVQRAEEAAQPVRAANAARQEWAVVSLDMGRVVEELA